MKRLRTAPFSQKAGQTSTTLPTPPMDQGAPFPPGDKPAGRRKPHAIHLFSGPTDRADGLRAILRRVGWECTDIDTCIGPSHDLLSDTLWEKLEQQVKDGSVDFIWMGPPCSTFSRARNIRPGPPVLRSPEHPWGLPGLSAANKKLVAGANLLSIKCARLAAAATCSGVGWGLENPEPHPGTVSLFHLPLWVDLALTAGATCHDFDQCRFGSLTKKPTRVLSWGIDLSALQGRCNHTPTPGKQWNYTDFRGGSCVSHRAHPPIAGRIDQDGKPATGASAAYPAPMVMLIAKAITSRGHKSLPPFLAPS